MPPIQSSRVPSVAQALAESLAAVSIWGVIVRLCQGRPSLRRADHTRRPEVLRCLSGPPAFSPEQTTGATLSGPKSVDPTRSLWSERLCCLKWCLLLVFGVPPSHNVVFSDGHPAHPDLGRKRNPALRDRRPGSASRNPHQHVGRPSFLLAGNRTRSSLGAGLGRHRSGRICVLRPPWARARTQSEDRFARPHRHPPRLRWRGADLRRYSLWRGSPPSPFLCWQLCSGSPQPVRPWPICFTTTPCRDCRQSR